MDKFLDAFAKQLKFDMGLTAPLPQTEEGGYSLQLEPDLHVEISPIEEGVSLQAVVGKCEGGASSEEFLTTLMQANLLGQGTGGGALCLDKTGGEILLRDELTGAMPYPLFRSRLEQFCNYAEYWQTMTKEA